MQPQPDTSGSPVGGRADARLAFFLNRNLLNLAKKALSQLCVAHKNAAFYPPQHPSFVQSIEATLNTFHEFFQFRKEATFHLLGEDLSFEETPLIEESLLYPALIQACQEQGIGGMTFVSGLEAREITRFVLLLRQSPEAVTERGGVPAALREEGISHVTTHQLLPIAEKKEDQDDLLDEEHRRLSRATFDEAVDTVQEIFRNIQLSKSLSIRRAKKVVHSMIDRLLDDQAAFLGLVTIKSYDQYTYTHSVNVAILSLSMGKMLSYDKNQLSVLGTSALLHDIGKIRVPLEILNKPGPFTAEEWAIMRRHPIYGAEILSEIPGLSKIAMVVSFEHNLRYDLSGYPPLRVPRRIHPFSAIVGIADAYDAITSTRVYQRAALPHRAMRILMEKRGKTFDPILVKIFVNMLGLYPMGSLVRLDTDELAVAYRPNPEDLNRPRVILLRDGRAAGEVVDLREVDHKSQRYRRSIVEALDPTRYRVNVSQFF
jgi:putative nucleotidyltransferase with HDIG domain